MSYFATTSVCGRARLLAVPFGFGPRVAAETLCGQLGLEVEGWRVTTEPPRGRFRVTLNFGVMEGVSAPGPAGQRVWIDCLMWLRDRLPSEVANYEMFFAEAFFDTREQLLTIPGLKQIPPLLNLGRAVNIRDSSEDDFILVSFGGIETPYTQQIHRTLLPCVVLRSLLSALDERRDTRWIVCCVPPLLREELSRSLNSSRLVFVSPPPSEFQRLLMRASLHIVQPGLYGPFEAFELCVPVVFCPPFSYTQICQARKYDEHGLLGEVPLWPQLNRYIGPFRGDLQTEEPLCFERTAVWLRETVEAECRRGLFREWAETVVAGSRTPDKLTDLRRQYAQSRRRFDDDYVRALVGIIF